MPDTLKDFSTHSVDWRQSIKTNTRRTYFVIGSFLLIYIAIGLLIDLFIYSGQYPQVPLSVLFGALITLQLKPFATVIALIIAAVSLLVTFKFHDKMMLLGTKYKEITPEKAGNLQETQLYNVIEEMKVAAGLAYMPRVFIVEANYMNAFASGYSEKSAMVAITRGLLMKLKRDELQAVMAHEISHIRHMDIKLTLMASVLANIMLIVIDVMFYAAIFGGGRRDNRGRNQLFMIIMVLRFVLPIITGLLVLYLSRTREYMADAGCVELTRENEPLARALLKIQGDTKQNSEQYSAEYGQTAHESVRRQAYIFDPTQAGISSAKSFADAFSTHPDLSKRLAAIGIKSRK